MSARSYENDASPADGDEMKLGRQSETWTQWTPRLLTWYEYFGYQHRPQWMLLVPTGRDDLQNHPSL